MQSQRIKRYEADSTIRQHLHRHDSRCRLHGPPDVGFCVTGRSTAHSEFASRISNMRTRAHRGNTAVATRHLPGTYPSLTRHMVALDPGIRNSARIVRTKKGRE